MEKIPTDIQNEKIVTRKYSAEFLHKMEVVRSAGLEFCFGVPDFDFEPASGVPNGGDPGVGSKNLERAEIMISEPSGETNFEPKLFQGSRNKFPCDATE
jgi:hypothetical protein